MNTAVVRVVVVDDHVLLRRGLRLLLERVPGIEIVGEAADGREALAVIAKVSPDVVVTDARMPGLDGPGLVTACQEQFPGMPVMVLTTFDDVEVVLASMQAGAAGFLLKDVSPEGLAESICAVANGNVVLDPRVTRTALHGRNPNTPGAGEVLAVLTRAERAVAERVATGMTNADIAADLVVAEGTIKNHVTALLRKLDQPNRTSLALMLARATTDGLR